MRRRRRKVGASQLKVDLRRHEPERISRDLAHGGVRAWTHVAGRSLDLRGTVSEQPCSCARRVTVRWIGSRGHSPADQPPSVSHRAWTRIAALPAKALRSERIALAQRAARIRQIPVLVEVWLIAPTQLNRVHPD